jgi:GNAT superfamily N-acetyltransferase
LRNNHKYQVVSLKERTDLHKKQSLLTAEAWPEFIRHDDISDQYWNRMIEYYAEYQLLLVDNDEILSIITTVPLSYEGIISSLPDKGWDWVVQKSVEDYENNRKPTLLAGIQIVINPDFQGKGLSYAAVSEMSAHAKRFGFSQLLIPVRPSEKYKFPLIPIDDYLKWHNEKAYSMDPWIRVHEKLGGKVLNICYEAMRITGTIEEWEEWTGQSFPISGNYIIEKGLVPLKINIEEKQGYYIEPNVWVLHEIS